MGRLGGTGEAATNQRVTQLRQILNFAPGGDQGDQLEGSDQPTKSKLNESSTVKWVSRNNIHLTFSFVPGNQPVRYYYDEQELKAWALTDLKPNGIHSPLWVRPLPSRELEQYELVAGLRRYRGAQLVDIDPLPVRIFIWSDIEAFKASLVENKNRQDFSALEDLDGTLKLLAISLDKTVEEATSLLYQLDNLKRRSGTQSVLGHPQFEIVQALFALSGGITWESFVKTRLPLLKKPKEILEVVRQGKIEYTKGVEIAKIEDADARLEFLDYVISEHVSLAEIKQHVKSLKPKSTDALQARLEKSYKQFKKSLKVIEKNPKRLQQAEKLLQQLEKFVEQE
jgi:ParB family chromosome partitioning protein